MWHCAGTAVQRTFLATFNGSAFSDAATDSTICQLQLFNSWNRFHYCCCLFQNINCLRFHLWRCHTFWEALESFHLYYGVNHKVAWNLWNLETFENFTQNIKHVPHTGLLKESLKTNTEIMHFETKLKGRSLCLWNIWVKSFGLQDVEEMFVYSTGKEIIEDRGFELVPEEEKERRRDASLFWNMIAWEEEK